MKAINHSVTTLAAAFSLLAFSMTAHADSRDNHIELSAKQSYVFRTYLQGDEIKIRSKRGAVALTGVVSENFHRSLAQETVAGLSGVKSIDNRLEVKGAAPTANSDAWLRDKVKVALLFHRSVSTATAEVEVKDGIVTLRGEAVSQAQKESTAEYATYVEGVKGVKNDMTVPKTAQKAPRTIAEKVDDASITAQVNMMLLNHRSTSVLNTTVKTKRGVVTVDGTAGNASEKRLVTNLVADIKGVNRVNNRMSILRSASVAH
jgi:osmotically-inducible protein OsmY